MNYLGKRKEIKEALTPVPKSKCVSNLFPTASSHSAAASVAGHFFYEVQEEVNGSNEQMVIFWKVAMILMPLPGSQPC